MSTIMPARRRAVLTALAALAAAVVVPLGLAAPSSAAPAPTGADLVHNCTRDASASPMQKLCFSEEVTGGSARTPMLATAAPRGFGPADLRSAYGVTGSAPNADAHPTVAVVDAYGYPTLRSDLDAYRTHFGLPACTVGNGCLRIVNEDGHTHPLPARQPHGATGWQHETALDVDMVSAICPNCHILVVQADDDDSSGNPNLEISVQTAASLGAKYVSMSWGVQEFKDEKFYDAAFEKKGVAYVASSGDGGFTGNGVNWPAASPDVTAVGGTSLTKDTGTARGWSETTWNNSQGETTAGCSPYEAQPHWQRSVSTSLCSAHRADVDVSASADPTPGHSVATYSRGSWAPYGAGGTSASAPIVAAMFALAGAPRTYSNPAYNLYAAYNHDRSAFNDVTTTAPGHCTIKNCKAAVGYDLPTGLGSPQGVTGFENPAVSTVSVHRPATRVGWVGHRPDVHFTGTDSQPLGLHYQARGLPAGLYVSAGGTVTGRIAKRGHYTVTVVGYDASGGHASTSFRWVVRQHTLVARHHARVHGKHRLGHTLRLTVGPFRVDSRHGKPVHAHLIVHWYANGHRIHGAHHRTLHITSKLLHKRLRAHVTAERSYFRSYHATVKVGRVRR